MSLCGHSYSDHHKVCISLKKADIFFMLILPTMNTLPSSLLIQIEIFDGFFHYRFIILSMYICVYLVRFTLMNSYF